MRAAGSTEPIFRVDSAGLGAKLRAGAVVSVQVLEGIGAGRYLVSIDGRRMVAAAVPGAAIGSSFLARTERGRDGLVLKPLPPAAGKREDQVGRETRPRAGSEAPALRSVDAALRFAVAALMKEGVKPEGPALARVRRAAGSRLGSGSEGGAEGSGEELGSLAARMEAKGLRAEAELVQALASRSWAGGGGGSGGRPDRRAPSESEASDSGVCPEPERAEQASPASRGPEKPSSGSRTAAGAVTAPVFDPETAFLAAMDERQLPASLGGLLRSLLFRAGGEGGPLNLFNHLPGPEGTWIYAPFRFALDSVAFTGNIRVRLPYVRGGMGRLEARFTAARGRAPEGEPWRVALSFGGLEAPRLRISAPRQREAATRKLAPEFISDLAAAGCVVELAGDEAEYRLEGIDLDA